MRIKGIIWAGSAVEDLKRSAAFFNGVLGMEITTDVRGFTRLEAENGDRLELFGPDSEEHDQLDTGPVAGFWIDDAEDARRELIAAGVDSCTEIERGRDGHAWFYFRAPNGEYYELCEHVSPRPAKGTS